MRIFEKGEEVGKVSFGPYNYEYTGDNQFLESILEGAEEYTEADAGEYNEELETNTERFVDARPETRRRLLKTRFETYGIGYEKSDFTKNSLTTGSVVETSEGKGVVDEVITSLDEDESISGTDLDPDEESVYVVALASGGVGFFQSSDVESAEFGVDVDAEAEDIQSANSQSRLRSIIPFASNDWSMPKSWRESEKPARLILLDAWASMGAQFECDGGCCMSELKSKRLCAAMKDRVLGTTRWRNGWVE